MEVLDTFQALVLGIVQGLTEFIPVSSTAHLRIVPAMLGWADPGAAFSAVIQLGTLAAVLVYFAGDIRTLTVAAVGSLFSARVRATREARLAWAIALGTVPITILGLLLRGVIHTHFRALPLIAVMLIVLGVALLYADRRREAAGHTVPDALSLGWRAVFLVGCFQALALIPGASRSGSTILGALLLGLPRGEAARFSFLLGIPAIFGSGLLELPLVLGMEPGVTPVPLPALLTGLAAALVSGYASIAFLLGYLARHSLAVFVVYRILLGLMLLVIPFLAMLGNITH